MRRPLAPPSQFKAWFFGRRDSDMNDGLSTNPWEGWPWYTLLSISFVALGLLFQGSDAAL